MGTSNAPLKGIGFGVGGSYEHEDSPNAAGLPATTGGVLPGFFTQGQQQFFAYNPATGVVVAQGDHWRISPQGNWYWGPFNFLGEYVLSNQEVNRTVAAPFTTAHLGNRAWQVEAGWVLTGEDSTFRGVAPAHPFAPRAGQWGALQLVARFSDLKVDPDAFPLFSNPDTSAQEAAAWSIGLNWWLNRDIRILTSYGQTHFTGGGLSTATIAPGRVTQQDEKVFFTRMQLAF